MPQVITLHDDPHTADPAMRRAGGDTERVA
jgi:hypothetical protein